MTQGPDDVALALKALVLNHPPPTPQPRKEKTLRSVTGTVGAEGRPRADRDPAEWGMDRGSSAQTVRPPTPTPDCGPTYPPTCERRLLREALCPDPVVPRHNCRPREHPGTARPAQTPRVVPGQGSRGAWTARGARLPARPPSQAAASTRPRRHSGRSGEAPSPAGPRPAPPGPEGGSPPFPAAGAQPRAPRFPQLAPPSSLTPRPRQTPAARTACPGLTGGPSGPPRAHLSARPPARRFRGSAPQLRGAAGQPADALLSRGCVSGTPSGGSGDGGRGSGGRGRGSSTGTGGGGAHAHARSRTHPHRRARPRKNVGSAGRSRGRGRPRTRPELKAGGGAEPQVTAAEAPKRLAWAEPRATAQGRSPK